MKKEIIKKILEFIKESERIMVILRAEAIDQTQNWKRYPNKRKPIDERINKLSEVSEELENSLTDPNLEEEVKKKSIVSAEDYDKLLANQKPDNLPVDWEKQLADKKQLEIKLNTAQTDLSNEQQARQQAENKIQQAEKFGLTNWDNLTNQIGSETLNSLLDRPEKSELAEVEKERDQRPNITIEKYTQSQNQNKQTIEKLKELIKEVDDKTSRKLERVETRALVEEVRSSLEKIVGELEKKVDLRNSSERGNEVNIEYQNQQLQLPKK